MESLLGIKQKLARYVQANRKWLAVATLAVPAFVTLLVILCFGVNVPFWDDWELVPVFQHLHAGHLYWQDFWQQHNEHRILLPNLVLVGLAYLTRWNTQVACLFGFLLAALAFWLLRKIIVLTAGRHGQNLPFAGMFLVALLWFSPDQFENWLWQWQLEWFMNVLGVVAVVYGLARLERGMSARKWLPLVLVGGAVAQYSLGNGTLVWPLLVAALLCLRATVWQVVLAGATGVSLAALYYRHYAVDMGGGSKLLALHHPLGLAHYTFVYIGRPLSFLAKPALAAGILLVGMFLALAVYLFFWRRELFRRAVPWIVLGLYALGSGLITGIARFQLGVGEALSSRYITVSMLFFVSLVALCWLVRDGLGQTLRRRYKLTAVMVGCVAYGLVLVGIAHGLHAAHGQHAKLVATHACTKSPQPSDGCLLTTYPDPARVRPRLEYLKTIHWGGY